jgi:hypothetical protein
VAASIIPAEHKDFDEPGLEAYKWVDLSDLLFSHATFVSPGLLYQQNADSAINVVIAQGLLSLYLTEKGNANDAWVTAGHATRLYQGLDVEDSGDDARNAENLPSDHSNIWWCLYILDRFVSRMRRVGERLDAGLVWVNCWLVRELRAAFGGMKAFATGREGGAQSREVFTNLRTRHVR